MHARTAIAADIQGLVVVGYRVRFSRAALENDDGAGRKPAALGEPKESLLAQPLVVRRIEEGEVEGRAVGAGTGPQVGGVAAMDAGAPEQVHGLHVLADRAAGGDVGLDEQAEGRAA